MYSLKIVLFLCLEIMLFQESKYLAAVIGRHGSEGMFETFLHPLSLPFSMIEKVNFLCK